MGHTELEEVLLEINPPQLPIIKLLLGYGANITKKVLNLASKTQNKKEIFRIFELHLKLLKQAHNNPTKELLKVSIQYNKPYVVQMIVDNKPELVTKPFVELARKTSPASVPILTKAMEIATLWEVGSKKGIPIELTHHIEKFVEQGK